MLIVGHKNEVRKEGLPPKRCSTTRKNWIRCVRFVYIELLEFVVNLRSGFFITGHASIVIARRFIRHMYIIVGQCQTVLWNLSSVPASVLTKSVSFKSRRMSGVSKVASGIEDGFGVGVVVTITGVEGCGTGDGLPVGPGIIVEGAITANMYNREVENVIVLLSKSTILFRKIHSTLESSKIAMARLVSSVPCASISSE